MPNNTPIPKTQSELSTNNPDLLNRSNIVRRDNDTVRSFRVRLMDIDEALVFFLENVVLAQIKYSGESKKVPIIYGSAEKWKSVRLDGYLREQNGKLQIPLVMFKRNSISKYRELANKIDEGHPATYVTYQNKWSKDNQYTPFKVLNNVQPTKEFYNVVVPEYVTIQYQFMVWTDYVEHMNEIIEAINYAEGSYWGQPDKYKFQCSIDSYNIITDISNSESDRLVRADFDLTMQGYLISDTLNRQIANDINKSYAPSIVRVQLKENT